MSKGGESDDGRGGEGSVHLSEGWSGVGSVPSLAFPLLPCTADFVFWTVSPLFHFIFFLQFIFIYFMFLSFLSNTFCPFASLVLLVFLFSLCYFFSQIHSFIGCVAFAPGSYYSLNFTLKANVTVKSLHLYSSFTSQTLLTHI